MDSLIGLAIFFVILAIATPSLVMMQKDSIMQLRASTAANEMNMIAKAANLYIEANYTNIIDAGGIATITINDLEQSGYLSQDINTVNPYGATWVVWVQEPVQGQLQGTIIASGGTMLSQKELGTVIAQTHGVGGEILPPNTNINGMSDNGSTAYGAYGSWQLNVPSYQNPGPGHLVGLLDYQNGAELNNDYLYRSSVPGQPQLNTMQTNIDMGNNSINNVNTIKMGPPNTQPGGCSAIDSEGHCVGQIMAAGMSENNLPNGSWGGLITRDVYSVNGTLAVGPGQTNANGGTTLLAFMDDLGGNNAQATGGQFITLSPSSNYTTQQYSNSQEAVTQTEGYNKTSTQSITYGAGSAFQVSNGEGAQTTLYAIAGGGPAFTGLKTDGDIALGNDQNGACNPGSRIWLANSQIYDGCNGDLYLSASGGGGGAVVTNAPVQLASVAVAGGGCTNGEIAASNSGNGQLYSCVNGTWQNASGGAFSTVQQVYLANNNGWNGYVYNTTGKTEFVSIDCPNTPTVSGYAEGGNMIIRNSNWQVVGTVSGRVQEGGSDSQFAAAPSMSAIVPIGGSADVSGMNLGGCTAEIAY